MAGVEPDGGVRAKRHERRWLDKIRVREVKTAANRYDRRDPRFRVALDEPTVEN
jgi:hypothetical protein